MQKNKKQYNKKTACIEQPMVSKVELSRTVFVGVSGGVDSSVAAAILIDQGYKVVGVFIRTWTPDFINCTWRDERRDAMRVCAHLGIPFLECDAEEEYKKGVADYMIEEYKKGRTPNPDVMCNRMVKFGVFWKFAKEHGADFIATGHYAIREMAKVSEKRRVGACRSEVIRGMGLRSFEESFRHEANLFKDKKTVASQGLSVLRRSPDESKDQSYFLWTLTQEDLSHILFPIGHLKKTEVRKLALKYKLPTATKKDSQGVCFLGPLDMKDFLKHYIEKKRGEVINKKGEVVGYHNGATFFTLGERHGFTITDKTEKDKPYYVIAKNIKKNTITVATGKTGGQLRGNFYVINNTNWISFIPDNKKVYQAQIRYHGELIDCKIKIQKNNNAEIYFNKEILVDSGQSIVIYDNDICMGGGIME